MLVAVCVLWLVFVAVMFLKGASSPEVFVDPRFPERGEIPQAALRKLATRPADQKSSIVRCAKCGDEMDLDLYGKDEHAKAEADHAFWRAHWHDVRDETHREPILPAISLNLTKGDAPPG